MTTVFARAADDIAAELATAPTAAAGIWTSDSLTIRDGIADGVVHGGAGHDLYGGSAGIAWFLAHHARQSGSEDQSAIARAGLHAALAAGDAMLRDGRLSLYSGAAGIALAAEEAGRALNDDALREAAARLMEGIAAAACAAPVAEHDLIAGKAGIVIALLAFGWARPRPASIVRQALRHLTDRLAAEASDGWWGLAWPDGAQPGLCGLGHGASGIGWALAEAAAYLGDDRLRDAASAALRYEAGHFSDDRGTWPDLRDGPAGQAGGWMDAWCHGAFGIGAVRWRMWDVLREPLFLAQATAAMGAARRSVIDASRPADGRTIDVTLCHGLGGAAELMLLAYEVTHRAEHLEAARKVGRLILRLRDDNGGRWVVGLPGGRDVPGLFLGLAGIGTTMMRLHAPESIASPMLPGLPARGRRLAAVSHPIRLGMTNPR